MTRHAALALAITLAWACSPATTVEPVTDAPIVQAAPGPAAVSEQLVLPPPVPGEAAETYAKRIIEHFDQGGRFATGFASFELERALYAYVDAVYRTDGQAGAAPKLQPVMDAFEAMKGLAASGDRRATFAAMMVGWCADTESGRPVVDQIRAAAGEGNPQGQYEYASLLSYGGCGVAEDRAESLRLQDLAMANGNVQAMVSGFRRLVEPSDGSPPDVAAGMARLRAAADLGYEPARARLLVASIEKKWDQTISDEEAIAGLRRIVPADGSLLSWGILHEEPLSGAYYHLATFTEQGRGGLAVDRDKAIQLYRMADKILWGASGNMAARQALDRLGVDHLTPEDRAARGDN